MPNSNSDSFKQPIKALIRRLFRPAVWGIQAEIERLGRRVEDVARAVHADDASALIWRGGLDGHLVGPDGSVPSQPLAPEAQATAYRYSGEIRYWTNVARGLDKVYTGKWPNPTLNWQRGRLIELASVLGLQGRRGGAEGNGGEWERLEEWATVRRAVEIGGGPCPAIGLLGWKSALAIDPLADAYLTEDLVPKGARFGEVAHIAAVGEALPIASGSADIVVCENCLDHVARPMKVMKEISRVLSPGGMCWVLVDLMEHADPVHPHPMSEQRVRQLTADAGLNVEHWVVRSHHSHPRAHGELRTLLRKVVKSAEMADAERNASGEGTARVGSAISSSSASQPTGV